MIRVIREDPARHESVAGAPKHRQRIRRSGWCLVGQSNINAFGSPLFSPRVEVSVGYAGGLSHFATSGACPPRWRRTMARSAPPRWVRRRRRRTTKAVRRQRKRMMIPLASPTNILTRQRRSSAQSTSSSSTSAPTRRRRWPLTQCPSGRSCCRASRSCAGSRSSYSTRWSGGCSTLQASSRTTPTTSSCSPSCARASRRCASPSQGVVTSGGSAAGRASGRALPRLTRSLAALGPQSAPSRARGTASSGGIIHPSVHLPRSSAHPPAVRAVPPPAATCRLTLSLTVTQW